MEVRWKSGGSVMLIPQFRGMAVWIKRREVWRGRVGGWLSWVVFSLGERMIRVLGMIWYGLVWFGTFIIMSRILNMGYGVAHISGFCKHH